MTAILEGARRRPRLHAARMRQARADFAASERAVRAVNAAAETEWLKLRAIIADGRIGGEVELRIRDVLQRLGRALVKTTDEQLRQVLKDSYEANVTANIKRIPRKAILAWALKQAGGRPTTEMHRPLRPAQRVLQFSIDLLNALTVDPEDFGADDDDWADLLKTFVFPPPTKQRAEEILRGDTWPDRKTWPQRLAGEGFAFDRITNSITTGIAQGENIRTLTERIRDDIGGVYWRALRIARTESLRVAAEMQRESVAPLNDITYAIRIVAVLDNRTRPEHEERDGTVYVKAGYEDKVAGESKIKGWDEYPNPPDAPNCRCRGVELMLGVDDTDLDNVTVDSLIGDIKRLRGK